MPRHPLPSVANIDDLLELTARAKAIRDMPSAGLTDEDAFQLGEGCELLASALDEERAKRAAERIAHAQAVHEVDNSIARTCAGFDRTVEDGRRREADLQAELEYQRSRAAELERRIVAANDQAEQDAADLLAAAHAKRQAELALNELREQVVAALVDNPSDPVPEMPPGWEQRAVDRAIREGVLRPSRPLGASAAYELPDDELAWYIASAREEQRLNGVVHPLAVLADRIELVQATCHKVARGARCLVALDTLAIVTRSRA